MNQVLTGALGDLIGGAIVTCIFFLVQLYRDSKRQFERIKECHTIIQGELARHISLLSFLHTDTLEADSPPDRLEFDLPQFDTAALRIVPLLGTIGINSNEHLNRFIELNSYIEEVERLNSSITALRSYYGAGSTVVFAPDEVDERQELIKLINSKVGYIKKEAHHLMAKFPRAGK
jgi:hypothetical protein